MDQEKQKNMLIAWLKDAYAMERALEETLRIHADEAESYPDLHAKLHEHHAITKTQHERLGKRLEELGETTSAIKNLSGEIMGRVQGYGTKLANDSIVKNALADFATEYFEIACYQAIAHVAEMLEDKETAALVEEIIEEEQEMADWAEENLDTLLHEFLEKEE